AVFKQYQELLAMDGVKLVFGPGVAETIAKEAIKRKTGARALRSIVEEIMLPYMYEVPSREDIKELEISQEMVQSAIEKKAAAAAAVVNLPDKRPKGETA